MNDTKEIPWQSGLLAGRDNRIVLGPDYVYGIERLGVRWVHVTDDGPDATPGERWWCEYLHPMTGLQAHVAPTLRQLVHEVRGEVGRG